MFNVVFYGPEDDPDERGTAWWAIEEDGEELAVIICRNYEQVKREHPEWIAAKERTAERISDALDFEASDREYAEGRN